MAEQQRREKMLLAQRDFLKAQAELEYNRSLQEHKDAEKRAIAAEQARYERDNPMQVTGMEPQAGSMFPKPIMERRPVGYTDQMNRYNDTQSRLDKQDARLSERDKSDQEYRDWQMRHGNAQEARLASDDKESWKSGLGAQMIAQGGGDPRAQQPQLRDPDGAGPLPPTWFTPPAGPATPYQIDRTTGALGEWLGGLPQDSPLRGMPPEAVAGQFYNAQDQFNPAVVEALGAGMSGYQPGVGFPGTPATEGKSFGIGPLKIDLGGATPDGPAQSVAERIASDPAFANMIRGLNKDGKFSMQEIRSGLRKFARDNAWTLRDVEAAFGMVTGSGGTIAPGKAAPVDPMAALEAALADTTQVR